MGRWKKLTEIRRQYGKEGLTEQDLHSCPIAQFKSWFEAVLAIEGVEDPTAMVLSTVDEAGHPDSRVVLLKGIEDGSFLFYTNYQSTKSLQLTQIPYAALNFYWPAMARQVRIKGPVQRTSFQQSETYFSSRPVASQLSAIISPQSRKISSRKELENTYIELSEKAKNQTLKCPDYWGGYMVIPSEMEFWQGRNDRLHDRILYFKSEKQWIYSRLAP